QAELAHAQGRIGGGSHFQLDRLDNWFPRRGLWLGTRHDVGRDPATRQQHAIRALEIHLPFDRDLGRGAALHRDGQDMRDHRKRSLRHRRDGEYESKQHGGATHGEIPKQFQLTHLPGSNFSSSSRMSWPSTVIWSLTTPLSLANQYTNLAFLPSSSNSPV